MSVGIFTIAAYKDEKFTDKVGSLQMQLNPESSTWSHQKTDKEAVDTLLTKGLGHRCLTCEFLLDSTGALPFASQVIAKGATKGAKIDLATTVKYLRQFTCDYEGEIHGEHYLIVYWGDNIFKCLLADLKIEFTLFDTTGIPLRAKCKMHFRQFMSDEAAQNTKKNSSPDMSHVYITKPGDTLPQISHRIYGSPRYYLQLAKENQLIYFRELKAGTRIMIPRLSQ